jgi:hypothetical protein
VGSQRLTAWAMARPNFIKTWIIVPTIYSGILRKRIMKIKHNKTVGTIMFTQAINKKNYYILLNCVPMYEDREF